MQGDEAMTNEIKRNRYVYAIPYDPDDPVFGGKPCYIGMGSNGRKDVHLILAKSGKPIRNSKIFYGYLAECLARGIEILPYVIAEHLTLTEAAEIEKQMIRVFGRLDLETGCLLNSTDGGFGSHNPPPSARKRMSEAHLGRIVSEETRKKIGKIWRGKRQPPDAVAKRAAARRGTKATDIARANMSEAQKGKKMSPEAIEKTSAALRGRKHPELGAKLSKLLSGRKRSAEAVAKTAAWHRGRKRTTEQKDNISKALAGKPKSEEHRAKLAKASKGKTRSPESKAKQSASTKGKPKTPETRARMADAARAREAEKRNGLPPKATRPSRLTSPRK